MKIDVNRDGEAHLIVRDIADSATNEEITSLLVGVILNLAGGYDKKLEEAAVAVVEKVGTGEVPFFSEEFIDALGEECEKRKEGLYE